MANGVGFGSGIQAGFEQQYSPFSSDTSSDFSRGSIQGSAGSGMFGNIAKGAVTGGAAGGPVGALAGAGVGAVKGIATALFTYYGMKKQEAENRRVESVNLAIRGEDRQERKEATAWDKYWTKKQYNDKKEVEKYNKVLNFMTGLRNQFAQKPQLGTNLVNMWNARR